MAGAAAANLDQCFSEACLSACLPPCTGFYEYLWGALPRWLWLWLCQCTSVCLWVCAQACSCKGWTSEVHVLKESEQHNSSASERSVWLSKLQTEGSQREVHFKSALFRPFPKLQIILGKLGRADPQKEMGKGLWGPPLAFLASSTGGLSCEMLSTGAGWFHWVKKSEVGFYFLMENTAQSRGLPFWGKVLGDGQGRSLGSWYYEASSSCLPTPGPELGQFLWVKAGPELDLGEEAWRSWEWGAGSRMAQPLICPWAFSEVSSLFLLWKFWWCSCHFPGNNTFTRAFFFFFNKFIYFIFGCIGSSLLHAGSL